MQKITESHIREKGLFAALVQFVKFGLVGASNTLISLAIYYLFLWISRDLYVVGQIVGFFVSVLNAYYWNNRYVFSGGKFWDIKKLLKTYIAYGGSTLLSLGLSVIEVELLHLSEWIVPVVNLCITIPLNFLTHKFWVYRRKSGQKRAIVTGATGMLGAATVRALLENGYAVAALVRPGSPRRNRLPDHGNLTVVETDLAGVPKAELPPADVWFHFAWGATGPSGRNDEAAQQNNVDGSLAALEKAGTLGCKRFVFAGSQAEYGICPERIFEQTPCAPLSAYGKAKLAFGSAGAERAKTLKLEFVHLRIFSVYGEEDRTDSLVTSCIRTFLAGEDMRLGPGTQTWNYMNAADFATLMVRVANAQKAAGIYNVGGSDTRPLKAFIEEIHALCGGNGRCLYGERPPRPEGEVQLNPDIGKACAAFGWQPEIPFREGINRMIEAERKRKRV